MYHPLHRFHFAVRLFWLSILLICPAIPVASADEVALDLSFGFGQEKLPPGAEIVREGAKEPEFLRIAKPVNFPEQAIKSPFDGAFAVTAIVRAGKAQDIENRTASIVSLQSASDDQAVLRVSKGEVQFIVQVEGQSYSVSATRPFPKDRWTLVGGIYQNGYLICMVDGYIDAVFSLGPVRPRGLFSNYTMARDGTRFSWLGDIARVAVFAGTQDLDALAAKMKFTAPPDTMTARLPRTPAIKFPWANALRVGDEVVHPIVDSGGAHLTMVPWSGPKGKEMLSSGPHPLFGHRVGLLRPIGADQGYAREGLQLPLYDQGETTALRDARLCSVIRPDGLFDLISLGGNTPFGPAYLNYYRNTGAIGAPKFETAYRRGVDGKSLTGVLGETAHGMAVADVNGDDVPDLLVVTREPIRGEFPDGISYFLDREHPNAGRGKGYDVAGNWLGDRLVAKLFWAPGQWTKDNELKFGALAPVYFGEENFQVQWHTNGQNVAAGGIKLKGKNYVLLFGDVDQVLALPVEKQGDALRCPGAEPLLADGATLKGVYYSATFGVLDLDDDGVQEIIMGGNPGRPTVLKGDAPGNFREVGTLNRKGGLIEMDTLAVPCRVDWNGDGFQDIIAGDASGFLWFWPGTTDPLVYGKPELFQSEGHPIRRVAGPNGSIQGPSESGWGYLSPTVGEWGEGGGLVIITNDIKGELRLFRPLRPGSLELSAPEAFKYQGRDLRSAWRSRPAILPAEVNGKGGKALVFMDWDGDLALATPAKPGGMEISKVEKLLNAEGKTMRFCAAGGGNWGRTEFAVCDWDKDGRWDVLMGTIRIVQRRFLSGDDLPVDATPIFLRNIGTNENPIFAPPKPIRKANGEFVQLGHHICAVWPTDLDNDGEDDLIMGAEDGKIYYVFRNELSIPDGKQP